MGWIPSFGDRCLSGFAFSRIQYLWIRRRGIREKWKMSDSHVELKNNDGKTGSDLWPDKFEEHRKIQRKKGR